MTKASIIVNKANNLITQDYVDVINYAQDCLQNLNVEIPNILITTSFASEYEKLMYDSVNDFVLTIGNNSNIKGSKRSFELPLELAQLHDLMLSIVDYVNSLNKSKRSRIILKTFGVSSKQISKLLNEINNSEYVITKVQSNNLDNKIIVEYDSDLDVNIRQDVISSIYEKLRAYIYTDEDMTIYELACNLLNVSHKTLSIVELSTNADIIKNMQNVDKNDNIKLCLSTSKLDSLRDILTIQCNEHNPVELAYELGAGLLDTSGSDMCLALYKSADNYYYVAVGDADGIHVYKNTCTGGSTTRLETMSKSAIFYLIKKIKQNDLFFNQIIV